MSDFIHLHVHSHYSVLDGIIKINELVEKAKIFGQNTVALTDHGNLFGVMEFQKECKTAGIKPIYGAELYIAPKSRFEKNKEEKYYHIVLLAKNEAGYRNLIKLCSIGYLEGFYSKPRIDKEVLREYSEGLVVLTACLSGEIPRLILAEKEEELQKALDWYVETFGRENFFLEIQNHNLPEEHIVSKKLLQISQKMGLGVAASCDAHYIRKEDSKLQEIVFAIRDKNILSDPGRYRFANDDFYLKSPEEMEKLFSGIPEALSCTRKIAEMCDVDLKFGKHTPLFRLPEGETADSFLSFLCQEGLSKRFAGKPEETYQERLLLEIDLIKKMGFSNYFLIVSDFVNYAKETGILVGPGRGSAAGALISYSLGITDVDPIQYGLLFERFLNPERISMPDIDVDFQDDRRDEVKEYIRAKYGYDKTADIITFGVMKSRAALKDVGRVLAIPLENVNRITKLIDNKTANEELSEVVEKIPELKVLREKGTPLEKDWIADSISLDGTIRNIGTHASGLIISDIDLSEIVPLYRDVSSGLVSTQFEGEYLEKNGLLKMDILGLSNLTMIKDSLAKIRRNHNVKIDLSAIAMDDREVFELFWKGETMGIFQFESAGMTEYLKQLKPTCVEDLIAMNALYRPGPMDNIPSFIARKQGREKIDCFHQNLEPILKATYGVIVYQEQVMQIAQVLAGFSLGKADVVRRMMAKKKPEELDKIRPEWIEGSVSRGYSKELAEKIFDILVPFSNYAFNKSHSAAYAVLAYQIAYLKTHYPLEFMASLLTLNMSDTDNVRAYSQEAASRGIQIVPPDINLSLWEFKEIQESKKDLIVFGFGGIKGFGEGIAGAVVEEREIGGQFHSFDDFINRMIKYAEFKKGAVEILIKAGCFDAFFSQKDCLQEKAILLYNLDGLIVQKQKREKDKKLGQIGLFFGTQGEEEIHIQRNVPPLSLKDDFQNEVSLFGFYLSGKLFSHHSNQFGKISSCTKELINRLKIGTGVLVWGFIREVTIKVANNKKNYVIFSIDNGLDSFKLYLFSEKYEQFQNQIVENHFVAAKLVLSEGKNGIQYEVAGIKPLESIRDEKFTQLHICLDEGYSVEEARKHLGNLRETALSDQSRGMIQLVFHIVNHKESQTILASDKFRVRYSTVLMDQILKFPNIKGYWFY
jgi:DNA polymerase-3 subunit alpha